MLMWYLDFSLLHTHDKCLTPLFVCLKVRLQNKKHFDVYIFCQNLKICNMCLAVNWPTYVEILTISSKNSLVILTSLFGAEERVSNLIAATAISLIDVSQPWPCEWITTPSLYYSISDFSQSEIVSTKTTSLFLTSGSYLQLYCHTSVHKKLEVVFHEF